MFQFVEALTFDDVLLSPKHSTLSSRSLVDTTVELGPFKLKHPWIPANMATVMNEAMIREVLDSGGLAIMHRFCDLSQLLELATIFKDEDNLVFSVGASDRDRYIATQLYGIGVNAYCLDIAHGDSQLCVDMIAFLKCNMPGCRIIAGNVATAVGAERLWSAGAHVVKVGVGPGCLGAGTRILLANGTYKNIEDIKIHERIINKDGNAVDVIGVRFSGFKKVLKYKTNIFHKETYVTPDHQHFIGDYSTVKNINNHTIKKVLEQPTKFDTSKYMWKALETCTDTRFLAPKNIKFEIKESFKINLKDYSFANRNWKWSVTYADIYPTYALGYIFGTFLGDGNANIYVTKRKTATGITKNTSGSLSWYFGLYEKEIAKKLSNSLKEVFAVAPSIKETKNTTNVTVRSNNLSRFFMQFGKKNNKCLPFNFWCNNTDYNKGLLDGLIDSDGTITSDGRIGFTNTSEILIEQFSVLFKLIYSYFPSISKKNPTVGNLINCNINNCKPAYNVRSVKNPQYNLTSEYQILSSYSTDVVETEVPTYDIEVADDTHSFVANNVIVHNSTCSTRVETGNGVPQFHALLEISTVRKGRPLIADGGLKSAGDAVKALCFADAVMAGNLFAGCAEAPGNKTFIKGKAYKAYNGSSTHKPGHIEGVEALVPIVGPFKKTLDSLMDGVKSGCSYQGVSSVKELQAKPQFVRITSAGLQESKPHDVILLDG